RSDWGDADNTVTVQGDVYHGDQDELPGQISDTAINGGNLLGRWTRRFEDNSSFQLQTYTDRAERGIASGNRAEVRSAAAEWQYNFALTPRQDVVVGAGVRVTRDRFRPGPGTALLDPDERTLTTYNAFVQDTFALSPDVDFIAGLKLEDNSYTGTEYMPSGRIA